MAIEHKNIPDAERHEPKGASTATSGQVLRSLGSGTTGWSNPSSLSNISIASMLEGVSTVSQAPTTTDTPYQVTWGSGGSNADVNIASNGVVTISTAGLYLVTFNMNLGRSGNTGVAKLLARLLINDSPTGFVQSAQIDTSANVNALNAVIFRTFAASNTIKVQILRDSTGDNDGGLIAFDPTLSGWDISPSAAIRVQKVLGGF